MSESSLRAESDVTPRCERCRGREAVASWAAVVSVDGVLAPPVTLQVCTECAAELEHVPLDGDFHLQPHPAPRGVLARVRWAWMRWRFARAVRRAAGPRRR